MRMPPLGQLWIHVDRLDRTDGKVWAVQSHTRTGKPKYQVATAVILANGVGAYTEFFGANAEQPKAVVTVPCGHVEMRSGIAFITARLPVSSRIEKEMSDGV